MLTTKANAAQTAVPLDLPSYGVGKMSVDHGVIKPEGNDPVFLKVKLETSFWFGITQNWLTQILMLGGSVK